MSEAVEQRVLAAVLAAFGGEHVNLKDLSEDDPMTSRARLCERLFTQGVDMFRSVLPNERLRDLGRVVWDLVGHKQVLVALGPDVPTLSFTVMQHRGVQQGIVLIPRNWPEMINDDYFMQCCAILFVGAQIVDYYNDRLIGDPTGPARWRAYEAELLNLLAPEFPNSWKPNEYQQKVLADFPKGLDSPGVVLYPVKSYEPSKGDA